MIFLLGIIIWCFRIMEPFASIILWSLILSLALYSIHDKLSKKLKGRPKLASILIVFSVLIIIIIPSGIIIDQLIQETKILKINYDNGNLKIPVPPQEIKEWPVIGENIYGLWLTANSNIEQLILKYKDQLFDIGSYLLNGIIGTAKGLVQIILSLVVAGVILSKGGIRDYLIRFFRKIGGKYGDEISDVTMKTINSVVKGVIGEALVLAILNGIVFVLADVPYAGLWAFIVFILAVLQLPVFILTIPIMIYFFAVKEIMPAVLWSVSLLIVSISDNFLTPMMLGKNAPVPMIIIFIGVIGGCVLSGFIGLFTGAVVMSIGYTLFINWMNSGNTSTTV
ncbi:MAG: AI-2E family transporter [Ignavibacteriae bacterium]|nr:AI-2E family transporter [Ignavibacteriota bacterium]